MSIFYAVQTYEIYTTYKPLELETQLVSALRGWFSLCGAVGRLFIDKLALCSYMRIRDDFEYKVLQY